MCGEKGRDARVILIRQHRAGDIGDAPATFHQPARAGKHRILLGHALIERAGADAPFCIRVAPPHAHTRAGRIDQREIELSVEIGNGIILAPSYPASWGADLRVAHASALQPLMDGCQAAGVDIGGEDLAGVVHQRCQRQRLAATACAQINHLHAGLDARQRRDKLGAFILNLKLPFDEFRQRLERRAPSALASVKTQADG